MFAAGKEGALSRYIYPASKSCFSSSPPASLFRCFEERERKIERKGSMVSADTSMTKVFVGGLAWETEKEALKEHFDRFGEILEAVIIFDKATGRSKGYGFVTFKEAEAAKKACEEATPMINGRRANCNLASLGARRIKPATAASAGGAAVLQPPLGVPAPKSRSITPPPPPQASAAVPLYYPYAAPPFQHQFGFPYYVSYGYSPSYLPDVGHNRKLGYPGGGGFAGGYLPVQYPAVADPEQAGLLAHGGALPASYPWYQWHAQRQAFSVPPHAIAAAPTAVHNVPTVVISKPPPSRPPLSVEQVAGCR